MTDFPLHTIDSAPEASRALMQEAEKRFGFVPNLYGQLAESPTALKAYHDVATAFAASSLSAQEQQVVLLTVSRINECHYCVAAHSMIGSMVKLSDETIAALRDGQALPDPQLEALRAFTTAVVERRGWVDGAHVTAFLEAGYTRPQVLDVLTGVTQKTLSNYANHLTSTPLDPAMAPFAWEPTPAV